MPMLTIGWCKNCLHKVGQHADHPGWRHFGLGWGSYLLNVNCSAYAGSTNTWFDLGAWRQAQWKCGCVHPEPDMGRQFRGKWVLK